jgi:hypothetical protein
MKKITTLAATLLASMALLPAQANVLHGYLEHQAEAQPAPSATPNQAPNPAPSSDSISGAVETLIPNSYPTGYQGQWRCITTVVDSGIAAIPTGSVLLSDVTFARQGDGRVTAAWVQPGWTESTSTSHGQHAPATSSLRPTDNRLPLRAISTSTSMDNLSVATELLQCCRKHQVQISPSLSKVVSRDGIT